MRFLNFIFCSFLSYFGFAQKVSDAKSRQEQSNIIVSYSLETESPCKISLYVSTDGGRTWTGPLKKVKGDVGNKVFGGDYKIEWSVLDEYNELRGNNIKFQVRAESNFAEFGTVKIGNQEWSAKNLDVNTYSNGDEIPEVQDEDAWSKLTTGAWCYYENKSENGVVYGKLYNCYALQDTRGIAPAGFHVPTDLEWSILIGYLGKEPGEKMKFRKGWNDGGNGNNNSGFSGLPGGRRESDGSFSSIGIYGGWWSASKSNSTKTLTRKLNNKDSQVPSYYYINGNGFSVRLVKD